MDAERGAGNAGHRTGEAERWARIERVYHSALELDASLRAAFVERACEGDESSRLEVESLIAHAQLTGTFLDVPAVEVAARGLADALHSAAHTFPTVIGRYRIVRLLGEGGMGTVYEAEQDEPRRTVALKVIKLGFGTPERLRRFRLEAQALARLQHPGIAQIYEANTADTPLGPQPYFAMEFICGQPLREHAESRQLDTRQRLSLMAKVCDAVHHAHQRGFIHRDLKPGNILVDETGQPKILDFGVARPIESDDQDLVQRSLQTNEGQLVGTLAYMSPEQVLGDPLEVDIRSDVYSVGVILYEILSGTLPYRVDHRRLSDAVRTIREEEPPLLGSVNRSLRGDIETVVSRALEKDNARRYGSASELGADIQRFLRDEPISARPPSASYQLRKFARRHRGLVAGIAAVFVVLVAGVTVSTWQAIRANRASATASAVSDFLQNDLLAQASANAQASPTVRADPDLKVRTALDRAAIKVAGRFTQQPLVEAAIRETIGSTYFDLGIYPEAEAQLERSVDLFRRNQGEEHADTLRAMNDLVLVYRAAAKYAQAEPLAIKVLDIRRRTLGDTHPDTLNSMNVLGLLYRFEGKPAQAEALLSRLLELRRQRSGDENEATLLVMNNLGSVYQIEGKYSEAERVLTQLVEIRRKVSGPDHPFTLIAADNLGIVYYRLREYSKAEALFTENLKTRRRVLGEQHPDTTDTMNNLGAALRAEGKFAEAEPLLTTVLDTKRRVLGEEHPSTLISMLNAAVLYQNKGEYASAEALMVKGVELQGRVLAADHPDRLAGMNRLAALYDDEGKYNDAEALFSKTLEAQLRVLGSAHPDTLSSQEGLARVQLRKHEYVEAESTLRAALRGYDQAKTDSWERYDCQSMLGGSLSEQKRYAEAEPLLIAGYSGVVQREAAIPLPDRPVLSEAGERVVHLYEEWRQPAKAVEWRKRIQTDSK